MSELTQEQIEYINTNAEVTLDLYTKSWEVGPGHFPNAVDDELASLVQDYLESELPTWVEYSFPSFDENEEWDEHADNIFFFNEGTSYCINEDVFQMVICGAAIDLANAMVDIKKNFEPVNIF